MSGQDLLSAALNECGLGELFSSDSPEGLFNIPEENEQVYSPAQYDQVVYSPDVPQFYNENQNAQQYEDNQNFQFVSLSSTEKQNQNQSQLQSQQSQQPQHILQQHPEQQQQQYIEIQPNQLQSNQIQIQQQQLQQFQPIQQEQKQLQQNQQTTITPSTQTIGKNIIFLDKDSRPSQPNVARILNNATTINGKPQTVIIIKPSDSFRENNKNSFHIANPKESNSRIIRLNPKQFSAFKANNIKVIQSNSIRSNIVATNNLPTVIRTTDASSLLSPNKVITVQTISSQSNNIRPSIVAVSNTPPTTQSVFIRTNQSLSRPSILTKQNSVPIVRTVASTSILSDSGVSLLRQTSLPIAPLPTIKSNKQQTSEEDRLIAEEVKKYFENAHEEEEFANLNTFDDYMPAKLKLGIRHPDPVVETASLSSIPPPDIYYRTSIPDELIEQGKLSALQLESIIYASQQHENFLADGSRAGFLIGDGPGVGKGRTVAGIIYENYLQRRKRSLWFSVSTDLKYDAERDLFDIGAHHIKVCLLNKFKYGSKIHSPENENFKRGVIFSTYNSLIGESSTISGPYRSRMEQIIQWCGPDFDGVIIFDECHKAKNLFPSGSGKSTKTGNYVLELQQKLPKARVVYASATGASEPKNMGYMTRLGIWGPGTTFTDFPSFVQNVEKRGVGAMELVAIDLKMRGMYMARQLSFKGVTFQIEQVSLSREFIQIYNCCCRLWVSAKTKFEVAMDLMGAEGQVSKAIWTQFWASHQRFFKYLCIASKVRYAVAFVKEALRTNKSVVIGLQSTGEARTLEALEDAGGELNDFVSTAKSVFQSLIDRHFPAPNRKKLAKLMGGDTSFFDDLGLKLSKNENDEFVVEETEDDVVSQRMSKAKKFFDTELDSDVEFMDDDDESDFDSDDMEQIDEIMDEKLGIGKKRTKNGLKTGKFMDFLFGIPKNKRKRAKRAPKIPSHKKSLSNKYEKFYESFDNVGEDVGAYCENLRDELKEQLQSFGERLPPNTLDELIDELGGPDHVAEMTGRKGRVITRQEGEVIYETRTENDVSLDILNLVEKQRFMDDEKRVAIISEAASSGISLHADRRFKNQCRRVHMTVELPWSADRAIQQFGRTHRSNQVSAPQYVFLISDLAGEKRFASIVAKRLESLGALTHGDRRATETRDLSQFNVDTKYGRQALEIVMKLIVDSPDAKAIIDPPSDYSGEDFFADCRVGLVGVGLVNFDRKTKKFSLDKEATNINRFLNRILGLEVELQNTLFSYFSQTMEELVKQAKKVGKFDSGIIDLSSDVGNVQKLNEEKFSWRSLSGRINIQLHSVLIDRGYPFEKALQLYNTSKNQEDYFENAIGFYTTSTKYQFRKSIFLAIPESSDNNQGFKQVFKIFKPGSGLHSKHETPSSLKSKGEMLTDMEEIKKLWEEHYNLSDNNCTHKVLFNKCNNSFCDVGFRKRKFSILSGSVLTVWPLLEKQIISISNNKLQIVRLKTGDGNRYIGPMVPQSLVEDVKRVLNNLQNENNNTENK